MILKDLLSKTVDSIMSSSPTRTKYVVKDFKTPSGQVLVKLDGDKSVSGMGKDKTEALVDALKRLFGREDKE